MKKILYLVVMTLMLSGCLKLNERIDRVDDKVNHLESRVDALEELCKQMNTNISSLQTLVKAIQQNDYVTGVTPITKNGEIVGYTISFTKSEPITIYHGNNGEDGKNGSDGADGHTPQIGVKQDSDGIYYWTVDGDWLLDDSGNKVKAVGIDGKDGENGTDGKDGQDGSDGKDGQDGTNGADGITPQLKIENDYWYISYDNGDTWNQLGQATGDKGDTGLVGDSMFTDVDYDNGDYVIFTLSNGVQIKIPTWYAFEQLQILCNQMNTNIASLQTIIGALQNNDYVQSITPLMENGKEVGYTITFTKSGAVTIYHGKDGKDGANGNDGQNGTNGVDGKDGHTPQIGVKQDTDGIYYWTVDGEWLLDDTGNKIKAVGTDGKDGQDGTNGNDGQNGINGTDGTDGITPELKIENGYWYVSYDEGATWKQLGKATGEDGQDGTNGTDGKDGQDGDSFFQSVTEDETNVYITLADGSVFTLPKTSSYLFNRLQSITFIPKYSDGKVCVKDGIAELDFQVSPKDAVKEIAKNWGSILKAKSIYTITRAVSFIDMPILSCEADEANGVISITISDDNLSEEFFIGTQSAEIALALSDGNNEITSEYIPISPYHPYNEIWYTSANGEIIKPNSTNFGANLVSNTYQNGKGIIRCDGAVTTIVGNAFTSKTLLSVILPSSVTTIGNYAFSHNYDLSIVIPKNVTSFGISPFERCGGIVTVNCNIPSLDTSIFTDFTEAIVGAGVTTIGDNAFYGNEKITKISLPNSLNSIGDRAFYGCVSLVNIVIPDSVTTIGDRAFYKCI